MSEKLEAKNLNKNVVIQPAIMHFLYIARLKSNFYYKHITHSIYTRIIKTETTKYNVNKNKQANTKLKERVSPFAHVSCIVRHYWLVGALRALDSHWAYTSIYSYLMVFGKCQVNIFSLISPQWKLNLRRKAHEEEWQFRRSQVGWILDEGLQLCGLVAHHHHRASKGVKVVWL